MIPLFLISHDGPEQTNSVWFTGAFAFYLLMLNRTCLALSVALAAAVFSTTAHAQTYAFSRFAGVPTVAGSNDGTNFAPQFNVPLAVAVDSSGNTYVADTANHTIRRITIGGTVSTPAGLGNVSGSTDGTGSLARFF